MVAHHDHVLETHESKIDNIQRDITDIKTRLGIKDLTNGQVLKYHEDLEQALREEREERKEQFDKLDSRIWAILVGIIILFIGELVQAVIL